MRKKYEKPNAEFTAFDFSNEITGASDEVKSINANYEFKLDAYDL